MYAIIEIETTDGNPYRDKIIEIAVFIHDGEKVIREYCSLINPERRIPPFISRMTSITDEMVSRAPRFYEIARDIVEISKGMVFVAHSVNFDYRFIHNEFKKLGYDYSRNHICTVKLSRRLLPGKKSYSLGRLCKELKIDIDNRHRAASDALATVKLFELLLKKHPQGFLNRYPGLHTFGRTPNPALSEDELNRLPLRTGVYFFFNEKYDIIYIGKSKNIRQRVRNHFSALKSQKALEMSGQVCRVDFVKTGSELAALLLESEKIKSHQPLFNRSQRRSFFNYGLHSFTDSEGCLNLKVGKTNKGPSPYTSFVNRKKGQKFLSELMMQYQLCQNLCGFFQTIGPCFQYTVKQCRGACLGKESPESYNQRVEEALKNSSIPSQNMIIIDKGRHDGEKLLVLIKDGCFSAYDYADLDKFQSTTPEGLAAILEPATDDQDEQLIISGFVRHKRVEKVIPF